MSAKNKPNEINLVRVYEAPVKKVWDAWVDPKQVGQWWGPRGFTITTKSKDVKPGGIWDYTMLAPDGTVYPNKTLFLEVEKHAKLVYDHGATDETKPLFRVTVLFSEDNGKTTIDLTMALPTAEQAAQTRIMIQKAGGNSTWDRLGEYLEKENSGKDIFIINRAFDAPLDVMFDMWTNPDHFMQWLPPTGATMNLIKGEIKAGSEIFYSMNAGNGMVMYGRVQYKTIEKPGTLVYAQEFRDADNTKTLRHPMAPTWPETMLATVQLTEEAPDRTRVTVLWEPQGTAEEIAFFVEAKAGMTMGWTGSFDKLEAYLPDHMNAKSAA